MITVIILGIFVIVLGFLNKSSRNTNLLLLAFILIFFFLSLRYNYGNDYKSYHDGFNLISKSAGDRIEDYRFDEERWEMGWVALNIMCEPIGFFGLVVLWSLFYCIVFYKFFKRYIAPNWYWLALFLLIFMPSALLIELSMLRNCTALLIFILAFNYLIKPGIKNTLLYLFLIYIATFFHNSANVLFPLVVLPYVNFTIKKWAAVLITCIYVILFSFSSVFAGYIVSFIENNEKFNSYMWYVDRVGIAEKVNLGIGFIVNLFLLMTVLLSQSQEYDARNKMAVKMLIIYNFITPIGALVPMVGRVGYFFIPFVISSYANVLGNMHNKLLKTGLVVLLISFTLYQFFMFMYDPVWIDAYMEYQTIFSAN